jgi:hypothetical protein
LFLANRHEYSTTLARFGAYCCTFKPPPDRRGDVWPLAGGDER